MIRFIHGILTNHLKLLTILTTNNKTPTKQILVTTSR